MTARIAAEEGVDEVYAPTVEEMYPDGFSTTVSVGDAGRHASRAPTGPATSLGVATVVLKLLQRVEPDLAYFGQKDAQQLAVMRRMVRDLDVPCGRPRRRDRARAGRPGDVLAQRLPRPRAAQPGGQPASSAVPRDPQVVEGELDYLDVVDPDTFEPLPVPPGRAGDRAARFGGTRLIDNIVLEAP